jgi:hypothetical protein
MSPMFQPFFYPTTPLLRRHGPQGYSDGPSYKPWLRDEFAFRCVFCLLREHWYRPFGADLFGVEHLIPRSRAPHLEFVYDNLLYACATCNSCKRDEGPLLDPTKDGYGNHLRLLPDGSLAATTNEGKQLIQTLNLNRFALILYRRELLEMAETARDNPQSEIALRYRAMMVFPDDLPNLTSLRPPGGNTRPDGLLSCCFAQRQRGELPATY